MHERCALLKDRQPEATLGMACKYSESEVPDMICMLMMYMHQHENFGCNWYKVPFCPVR